MAIKYKRVLIKVSGEALAGEDKFGVNDVELEKVARQIKEKNAKRIFLHFDSAVKIHKSLVKRFCEGDKDKTLKTKAFPAKVSELWLDLQAKKGDAPATDYMIEFINQFPQDKVKEIWDAKGYKGDDGAKVTKDAVRIGILETQFNEYLKQHPFDTED